MTITNSQKANIAPIGWRLQPLSGAPVTFMLPIRPEELTYDQPSMQAAIPTLDGAFLDDFGNGIATAQISGHTGWGQGSQPDGHDQFATLHTLIWKRWRAERQLAIQQGQDPNVVQLIFVDSLNGVTILVAPGRFIWKRSKSRPLLHLYQISMTVMGNAVVPPQTDKLGISNSSSPGGILAGLKSLATTVTRIANQVTQVANFVEAAIANPTAAFMGLTLGALNGVMSQVDGVNGVVSPQAAQIVGIAGDLCQAACSVFRAYGAVASLTLEAQVFISSVASAYHDAYCVLRNALRATETYPDYTGLYGASNCSSTIGGSPVSAYAGMNPWTVIAPIVSTVAAVTPTARQNIDVLRQADPVLLPMPITELGSRMAAIAAGVKVLA